VQNVTDRTSNPFGMSPPCPHRCSTAVEAVYGYGDANADVHVIGDHPGVHGGATTGVPFTDSAAGEALQSVLAEAGLLAEPGDAPSTNACFLSYLHACCPPAGETPSPADYADMERFFDAELRAIAAHVLVPVGERATAHGLRNYTARAVAAEGNGSEPDSLDMDALHATDITGSGWLVLPFADPGEWDAGDREAAQEGLSALLARDYRQTSDLGRFLATDDPYLVR